VSPGRRARVGGELPALTLSSKSELAVRASRQSLLFLSPEQMSLQQLHRVTQRSVYPSRPSAGRAVAPTRHRPRHEESCTWLRSYVAEVRSYHQAETTKPQRGMNGIPTQAIECWNAHLKSFPTTISLETLCLERRFTISIHAHTL
jgi:hypothetical protein